MIPSAAKALAKRIKDSGPPIDPNFADVKFLMHADDGFVDVKGNAVSAVGSAMLSTTHKAFGTYSFRTGGGGYVSVASSPDFDMPGNFTIEFWVYLDSTTPDSCRLFSRGAYNVANNIGLEYDKIGKRVGLRFNTPGATPLFYTNTNSVPMETPIFLSIDRIGTTITIRGNGVTIGTGTSAASANVNTPFLFGSLTGLGGFEMVGWLDEIRFTNGIARHTADYTVQSAPFPDL